jgi:hypothetical protein
MDEEGTKTPKTIAALEPGPLYDSTEKTGRNPVQSMQQIILNPAFFTLSSPIGDRHLSKLVEAPVENSLTIVDPNVSSVDRVAVNGTNLENGDLMSVSAKYAPSDFPLMM